MSEYLDNLKKLRDTKTPLGEAVNIQTNASFMEAIYYIERLEKSEYNAQLKLNSFHESNQEQLSKLKELNEQISPIVVKYSPKEHCLEHALDKITERIKSLETVLMTLIELKVHKDKNGKDIYYSRAQPEAWKKAKKLFKL